MDFGFGKKDKEEKDGKDKASPFEKKPSGVNPFEKKAPKADGFAMLVAGPKKEDEGMDEGMDEGADMASDDPDYEAHHAEVVDILQGNEGRPAEELADLICKVFK